MRVAPDRDDAEARLVHPPVVKLQAPAAQVTIACVELKNPVAAARAELREDASDRLGPGYNESPRLSYARTYCRSRKMA
jgi:hypothetical protein